MSEKAAKSEKSRLKDYFEHISWHGSADLARSNSKWDFVFWLIVVLGGICSGAYSIAYVFKTYQEHPTFTRYQMDIER